MNGSPFLKDGLRNVNAGLSPVILTVIVRGKEPEEYESKSCVHGDYFTTYSVILRSQKQTTCLTTDCRANIQWEKMRLKCHYLEGFS